METMSVKDIEPTLKTKVKKDEKKLKVKVKVSVPLKDDYSKMRTSKKSGKVNKVNDILRRLG